MLLLLVSGELYFAVICVVGKSPVDSRGGQLQIAGVVVGQWGALFCCYLCCR